MRILTLLLVAMLVGCDRQTEHSAAMITGGNVKKGKTAIANHGCATCHEIPGIVGANGLVGPPLRRVASRVYIGGVIKNTPQNMILWLQNPPSIDDKTAMPNLHLSDSEARDIASYLYTLK